MEAVSLLRSTQHLNLRLLASILRPSAIRPQRSGGLPPRPARRAFSSPASTQADAHPSSVSPSEISHFSRLASSWWDPHGPSRLLHLMNPHRHDFIQTCLRSTEHSSTTQTHSYLDIGCGGGIFASSAARLPHTSTVTAIDPTPGVIAVAKNHQRSDPALAAPKLQYLNCSIEDLSSSLTSFDSPLDTNPATPSSNVPQFNILTLFEVLEHISQPSNFLSQCIPYIKPGGWLIGSTIARSPISYLTTKVIAEAPLVGVVPRGTHDWNQYINPDELNGWFERQPMNQWGEMRTQGIIYLPALGWRMVNGSENLGNYFFGIQKP